MMSARPRLLVVDDEEAILETMTFTFEDDYEVLTASSAVKALDLLESEGPVAIVLSDQRMPEMTGVEFLSEVFRRHPDTVRIILTGFADMDAIIHAINDGTSTRISRSRGSRTSSSRSSCARPSTTRWRARTSVC